MFNITVIKSALIFFMSFWMKYIYIQIIFTTKFWKCISIFLPAQHINVDIISVATLFFGHILNINFEIKNFHFGTIFNFMNERYTKIYTC